MIDPDDVAMRTAVASAFRDCGLPSDEDDVDDFLVALRTYNYVVERLDRRTGEEWRMAHMDPITTRSRKVQESPGRGKP
jgi:hypothetical protein